MAENISEQHESADYDYVYQTIQSIGKNACRSISSQPCSNGDVCSMDDELPQSNMYS
jgi:hypothetical protein